MAVDHPSILLLGLLGAMKDILRDSTVGQFVNYVSGGGLLPYPEQRSDFVIPERYLARSLSRNEKSVAIDVEIPDENNRRLSLVAFPANVDPVASQNTLVREPDLVVPIPVTTDDPEQGDELEEKKRDGLAKAKHDTAFGNPEIKPQYELVEWYGPDDSDNPRRVSSTLLNTSFLQFHAIETGHWAKDVLWPS